MSEARWTLIDSHATDILVHGVSCRVEFTLSATDEDDPMGIASGDDAEDAAYMERIRKGEIYCAQLRMLAKVYHNGTLVVTGSDYLGSCDVLARNADSELIEMAKAHAMWHTALNDAKARIKTNVDTFAPWKTL